MMIRINLLPVRAAKKREMGRQILVLFAIVLAGAVVGNYMLVLATARPSSTRTPTASARSRPRSPSSRRSLAR